MEFKYSELKEQAGEHILGQVMDAKAMQDKALEAVRFKIAVLSGKGGVGKSAVTASLARALDRLGAKVAVLDADLNGPSQGAMLKPTKAAERQKTGISPAVQGGIALIGMDAFLAGQDQHLEWKNSGGLAEDSFVWRGLEEARMLQSLLRDTQWGERDFLLIDLPPGTDRIAEFHQILPELDGVLVVGVPSPVAGQVVARSLTLTRERGLGVLGLVENMARVACPHCGETSPLYENQGGLAPLAARFEAPFLGSVPFDHRFLERLDNGLDPFDEPGSAAQALLAIAQNLNGVLLKGKLPE